MEKSLKQIFDSVVKFDLDSIHADVTKALGEGITAQEILNDGMIKAMAEVGRLFEEGEYFVPELLVAAMTMQKGLDVIQPILLQNGIKSAGKVVLGTVKGDLHDVGKNLVGMMLKGAGFEVIDAGVDVSPEKFVEILKQSADVKILALSALLTTTMTNMKTTIDAVNNAGLRRNLKVMVGGAPLTEGYAKEIGADGYAADASKAVGLAKSLIA